jgi:hypothetical protein
MDFITEHLVFHSGQRPFAEWEKAEMQELSDIYAEGMRRKREALLAKQIAKDTLASKK